MAGFRFPARQDDCTLAPAGEAGATAQVTLTSKPGGSFNTAVALSSTGLPSGVTALFSKTSVPVPGSGSVTMTLTATSAARIGTSTLTVVGSGGATTGSATVALNVTH